MQRQQSPSNERKQKKQVQFRLPPESKSNRHSDYITGFHKIVPNGNVPILRRKVHSDVDDYASAATRRRWRNSYTEPTPFSRSLSLRARMIPITIPPLHVPWRGAPYSATSPPLYTIFESPLKVPQALRHDFVIRDVQTLKPCHLCQHPVFGKALQCADCQFLCHIKCEIRVAKPCYGKPDDMIPPRVSADGISSHSSVKSKSPTASLRNRKMSGRSRDYGSDMEVLYVTERILVLTFPTGGSESTYRNALKDISQMLNTKHATKYKVFNLSRRRNDLVKHNSNVVEFGWPNDLAPPLERLCAVCKDMETWLAADPHNVLVLHSKGGRSRAGLVVAAYMHYTNICASEDQALDRFAMKRFYDEHMDILAQPSQKRYVNYFAGLLSGKIKINSNCIYLQHIAIIGLPKIDSRDCNMFLKVYERLQPVFTSGVYTKCGKEVPLYLDRPLQLRGDILVKCYHRRSQLMPNGRDLLFRCQFNTCALTLDSTNKLCLRKEELDEACSDSRFTDDSRIEFTFSWTPDNIQNGNIVSGSVNIEKPSESIIRWDSYENFETTAEDTEEPSMESTKPAATAEEKNSAKIPEKVASEEKRDERQPETITTENTTVSSPEVNVPTSTTSEVADTPQVAPQQKTIQEEPHNEPAPIRPHPNDSTDSGISTSSGPPSANATGQTSGVPPPYTNGQVASHKQEQPQERVEPQQSSRKERAERSKSPITVAREQFNKIFSRFDFNGKGDRSRSATPKPENSIVISNSTAEQVDDVQDRSHDTSNHQGSNRTAGSQMKPQSSEAEQNEVTPPAKKQEPPPTPPKPRKDYSSPAFQGHPSYSGEELSYRPQPISPPTKRGISPRPGSPIVSVPAVDPNLIDVGLVGDDRYDPTSRAFAYVPTAALETHFKTPKKETRLVPQFDTVDGQEAPIDSQSWVIDEPTTADFDIDTRQNKRLYMTGSAVDILERSSISSADPSTGEANADAPGRQHSAAAPLPVPRSTTHLPASTDVATCLPADLNKDVTSTSDSFAQRSDQQNDTNWQTEQEPEPQPVIHRKHSDIHQPEVDALLDPNYYLSFATNVPSSTASREQRFHSQSRNTPLTPVRPSSAMAMATTEMSATNSPRFSRRDYGRASMQPRRPATAMQYRSPPWGELESLSSAPKMSAHPAHFDASYPHQLSAVERATDHSARHHPPQSLSQQTTYASGQQRDIQHTAPGLRHSHDIVAPVGQQTSAARYDYRRAIVPPRQHHSAWSLMDTLDTLEAAFPQTRTATASSNTSRSVGSTPGGHQRSLSSRASYDMDPDDWLESQLEKLRIRKELNDPEIRRRKAQEKQLLEELKHMYVEKQSSELQESQYTVEGRGTRVAQPATSNATESSYCPRGPGTVVLDRTSDYSPSLLRRTPSPKSPTVPPKPTSPLHHRSFEIPYGIVTGKPPTPPPISRERSRTPPSPRKRSPSPEKKLLAPQLSAPILPSEATRNTFVKRYSSMDESFNDLDRALHDSQPSSNISKQVHRRAATMPTPVEPSIRSNYRSSGDSNSGGAASGGSFDFLESMVNEVESSTIVRQPDRSRRQQPPPPSPAPIMPSTSGARSSANSTSDPIYGSIRQSPKPILKKPKTPEPTLQATEEYRYIGNSTVSNGPLNITESTRYDPGNRQASLDSNRPETPAFPVKRNETPIPYHPLLYHGANHSNSLQPTQSGAAAMVVPQSSPMQFQSSGSIAATIPAAAPVQIPRSPSPGSMYYGHSRRSSVTSLGESMEVIHHHPIFVKDTSKYWYKPQMSREETINILKDKPPGTFIIRDSNSFPGAFGLALKVATPPPGVLAKSGDDSELVRHFLIEPTASGVKLKGCSNEPVFGSLSALIYQHSITPLALPCKLMLPEYDPAASSEQSNSASALLEQGAACNVTYIHSCDCEALTGPEALRRVVSQALGLSAQRGVKPVSVHFKVSAHGITVTDNTRQLFFRRHYPVASVTFCGLDPDDRRWSQPSDGKQPTAARIFGFVARKIASRTENACHVFAELEPEQPATAIVNFVTKVMMQMHKR